MLFFGRFKPTIVGWDEIIEYAAAMQIVLHAGRLPVSKGKMQRVALVRAPAIEPELLMLYEPFTALDADSTTPVKRPFLLMCLILLYVL